MSRTKSLTPMVVVAVAGGSGCHDAVDDAALELPPHTGDFDVARSLSHSTAPGVGTLRPVEARLVEYGRSVEGRTLWLVRIAGPPRRSGLRPAALLMGGSQGGEELGILELLAETFTHAWVPAHLARDGAGFALHGVRTFLEAGGVLYVVPTVNPDGVAARTYANANGVNLNRDWAAQTQPETRYLVEYLRAEAELSAVDLRLGVDYHIGIPRLLYPRADSRTPIPVRDLRGHLAYHELMPERIRKAPVSLFDSIRDIYAAAPECEFDNDCALPERCHDGQWNCGCVFDEEWQGGRCIVEPDDGLRIERDGLSNDFLYDAFGAMAFVYEADPLVDFNNVHDHAVWWDRNLAYLAGDAPVAPAPRFDVRDRVSARVVHPSVSALSDD